MGFGQPLILLGLLFIPALTIWLRYRHHRRHAQWEAAGVAGWLWMAKQSAGGKNGRFSHLPLLAGLTLSVVALAQPQWGTTAQTISTKGLQIIVLLDLSNSMLVEDIDHNRLAHAHTLIQTISAQLRPEDELGLLGFAAEHRLLLPLTTAHAQLLPQLLPQAHPTLLTEQGSVLAPALETAVRAFPTPATGQPWLIVLTDGELQETQAIRAATRLAQAGVQLTIVGIGSEAGGTVPNLDTAGMAHGVKQNADGNIHVSRLDAATLSQIATAGNGRYLSHADAFQRLPEWIAQNQLAFTGQRQLVRPTERYQLFLLLAIVCLISQYGWLRWPMDSIMLNTIMRQRWPRATLWLCLLLLGCRANTPEAVVEQGNAAYASQAYEAAQIAYKEGVREWETAVFSYNLANTYYRMARFDQAVQATDAALSKQNDELVTNTYLTQGNSFFQQERYLDAIAAYQSILRHTPSDVDAKHNLELAWRMLDEQEEAKQQPDDQQGADMQEQEPEKRPFLPVPNGEQQFNPQADTGRPSWLPPDAQFDTPAHGKPTVPTSIQEIINDTAVLLPEPNRYRAANTVSAQDW